MEVTAIIIELSVEIVKGMQGKRGKGEKFCAEIEVVIDSELQRIKLTGERCVANGDCSLAG